jgi:fibronectin-binding autotransporter adhesin
MNKALSVLALVAILCGEVGAIAPTQYWDINGATAGAGGATPTGTWDTSTSNWTTDPTGSSATATWGGAANTAVFSAGTDATGAYTVTISGTQTLSALTVEEGTTITQGTGTLNFGATTGLITVASGSTWNNGGAGTGTISGTAGISKTGLGTLNLGSSQAYTTANGSQQLVINQGIVDFAGETALGATTNLTAAKADAVLINGGTLRYSGTAALTLNVNRGVTIGASGGTIDVVSTASTGLSLPAAAAFTLNGTGNLTKAGAGRFTMNTTANTFTGKYIVKAGDINVPGDGRFGTVPGSVTADYFTLDGGGLRSALTTATTWNSNRGITLLAGGGTLMQPGGGTTTDSLTYNGIIAGTAGGNLTIAPTDAAGGGTTDGIVILGGANTYDGATTVSTGMTLRLGASNVLPNTALTLNGTSTFDLANNSDSIKTIAGAGAVTLGSGTLTVAGPAGEAYSGVMSGTGKFVKDGSGALDLTGANTHNGGLEIKGGTLRAGNANAFGANGNTVTVTNAATIAGNSSTARSLNYAWVLNADVTLGQASGGTATLNLQGTMDLGGATRKVTLGTSAQTISATISNGSLLVDAGAGQLNVNNAANTYAGGTTIRSGGVIWAANGSLGSTGTVTLNDASTGASNTQLYRNSNGTLSRDVVVANQGTGVTTIGNDTGTNTSATIYGGALTLNKSINLKSGAGALVRVSGAISGPGGITTTGTGTDELASANTYGGGTTVENGGLAVGNKDSLGTGGLTIGDGATSSTLKVSSTTSLTGANAVANAVTVAKDFTVASGSSDLELSGTVALGAVNRTITVDSSNATILSGVISDTAGTGGLTKAGSGVLTLTGANTYGTAGTTSTTVSAGKLLVNNTTGSGTGPGDVLVNGGTLGGTGSIAGSVTVTSGSLAPGASINHLDIGGNLSLTGGSFDYEISSSTATADLNTVVGNLSLAGVALSASDLGAGVLAMGTKFTLINYGGTWNGGIFTGLANHSASLVIGLNRFEIDYDDTTGGSNFGGGSVGAGSHFVTITAVPEASTFLTIGLGGIFAIAAVWMSKRMGVNVLKV